MKEKFKAFNVALTLAIIVSMMLTACSSKQAQPNDQATPAATSAAPAAAQAATPAAPKLDPVDLVWYTIGTPQKDQQAVNDAMSKITKEKINATIKIITLDWGAYNDKMKVLSASGEPFDLAFTSSWANEYLSGVSKGAFVQVDDLLQKYGKDITGQVPAKYWDAVKVSGKTYAVLNYQIFASNNGLMVRKDLADKYHFDPKSIKKIADMEPFFEQIKKNEVGITPIHITGGAVPYFNLETGFQYDMATSSWFLPFYINAKDPAMKVLNIRDSKEYQDLEKLLHDWYNKGYIKKDAASVKDDNAERKSGKYASYVAGTLKPGGEIDDKNSFGHEVIPVPIAPAYINTNGVIATMTAISRTSKNPERAMMFLDLIFADKELYNLLCNGIEGKHYKKVDDKYIDPIADSGYAPNTDWEFGNQFNAFLKKGQQPDIYEATKRLNESAAVSPLLGFVYDKEKLKNEIAQVEAIDQEYGTSLATGTIDYQKYAAEIAAKEKKAGLDKIMEDVQNQINNWRKANGK